VGGRLCTVLLLHVASCGRVAFDPRGDVNDAAPGETDAPTEDSGPTVYFEDDYADSNYTATPAGTTGMVCNTGNCGTMTADVVSDVDGTWLRVMRAGAPADGGAFRVIYTLARPVGSTIHLHYKMRLAFDELNTGGGFCMEYGSWVQIRLTLSDATQTSLDYAHNYGTMSCVPDATWHYQAVTMNTWNTFDRDLAADLITAGLPPAVQLDEVRVGGSGWNFEVHYDDVTIRP
jgi:hypothetical protein